MNSSDALLTEILLEMQRLNKNVSDFSLQLSSLQTEVKEAKADIKSIKEEAFLDSNMMKHRKMHESLWHQFRHWLLGV